MEKRYLKPIHAKSMVQIVIDRITGALIEGELKPGDKIPTENELCESLSVSKSTVREAVRILVAYGVLEIRRADGTYICTSISTNVFNPAIYRIILESSNCYDELIGLRRIVEDGIMRLLMDMDVPQETWDKIEKQCDRMAQELGKEKPDLQKTMDADIAFHEEIAKATNNSLVLAVHDVVIQLTRESRAHTIEQVVKNGQKQYLVDTHRNLLEKLRGNDVAAMYEAVNDSYFYWKDIYKK